MTGLSSHARRRAASRLPAGHYRLHRRGPDGVDQAPQSPVDQVDRADHGGRDGRPRPLSYCASTRRTGSTCPRRSRHPSTRPMTASPAWRSPSWPMGIIGVLVMTSEYSSGMIRATLAAVPDRRLLLAAKAAVLGAAALAAGELLSFVTFLAGQAVLTSPAPHATLGQPGVLRAVLLAGAYLCLIGLIGLGIGAIIRHSAGGDRRSGRPDPRAPAGTAPVARLGPALGRAVPADDDRGELADRHPPAAVRPVTLGRPRHALPVRRRAPWRPAACCSPGGTRELHPGCDGQIIGSR